MERGLWPQGDAVTCHGHIPEGWPHASSPDTWPGFLSMTSQWAGGGGVSVVKPLGKELSLRALSPSKGCKDPGQRESGQSLHVQTIWPDQSGLN